jgi:peptide deformylase
MNEIFKYDTETAAKVEVKKQQAKYFKLVHETDPILRQVLPEFDFKNPPVNPEEFAESLAETCRLHRGIGLSANQCGFPYRVFVMGADDQYVAYFNPKITGQSEEQVHMVEGCLSFPFLGLRITRPQEIMVEYQNYHGEVKHARFNGISARCFQHELDHMNGIVYTSLTKPMALQSGMNKRNKIMRKLKLK